MRGRGVINAHTSQIVNYANQFQFPLSSFVNTSPLLRSIRKYGMRTLVHSGVPLSMVTSTRRKVKPEKDKQFSSFRAQTEKGRCLPTRNLMEETIPACKPTA